MKKILYSTILALTPCMMSAQSAIDAYTLSSAQQTKGTARFMSMGGAFTALGGDLSTMTQNPAGIGVYRNSEIGATLDIDFQNTKAEAQGNSVSRSQTRAYCNNVGYIGTARLNGAMRTFNWGVSYGRTASFDRLTSGYVPSASTSVSNYIASFTTANPADMDFTDKYNPYLDSDVDWLSILGYSSYMITPYSRNGETYNYRGLYQNGTKADAAFDRVRERGYVDEYNIDFGGNVSDVVMWGVGIGISDISYSREVNYSESMADAAFPSNLSGHDEMVTGNAGLWLDNNKYISGTGWNFKLGVIVKPIQELRIGLAVHTPTWYALSQSYEGYGQTRQFDPRFPESDQNPMNESDYTEYASFDWRLRSPWRLMVGVAGVIGNKAIVSLDYEYAGLNSMKVKSQTGYYGSFEDDQYVNDDIKDYFKATNTLRLGVEYRVTPQFSLRAGYNFTTTGVNDKTSEGRVAVYTSGTDPSYSLNKTSQNISFGLGYRYKAWYIDAAYIYHNRKSTLHAYTNFRDNYLAQDATAPVLDVTDSFSSLVISTGFKF